MMNTSESGGVVVMSFVWVYFIYMLLIIGMYLVDPCDLVP